MIIQTYHNIGETYQCANLQEIPETLFKNNTKAKSFWGTFAKCTELAGEVPKLRLRGDNSGANNYEGENPDGHGWFWRMY